MAAAEIVFNVTPCLETGGYVARWDDKPGKGGITTQGETLSELEEMVAEAVAGFFEGAKAPRRIRLHFQEDPVLSLKATA